MQKQVLKKFSLPKDRVAAVAPRLLENEI